MIAVPLTFDEETFEILLKLCQDNGLTKSSVVRMSVRRLAREGNTNDSITR